MDPETERMLREGVAFASRKPETFNANMHALSFLYLSHLRAKARPRNGPENIPPPPPPQPFRGFVPSAPPQMGPRGNGEKRFS